MYVKKLLDNRKNKYLKKINDLHQNYLSRCETFSFNLLDEIFFCKYNLPKFFFVSKRKESNFIA